MASRSHDMTGRANIQGATSQHGIKVDQTASIPAYGVLTKTVVESPIIHWIIPVRLRSNHHRDIAFIGENYVQISELRKDGQIHEVLRKTFTGSRIRNAVVFGNCDAYDLGLDDPTVPGIKLEEIDGKVLGNQTFGASTTTPHSKSLPPQLLVLILDSGDCLFMFLRKRADEALEFVISCLERFRDIPYIGYNFAIDPSHRYLAASSPGGIFEIFELESWHDLNERYLADGTFSPIKGRYNRTVNGIIHRMEFLFPRPEDEDHIILLFIIVRRELVDDEYEQPISRMVTYEWETGDSIGGVFRKEKLGTRLPDEHRMPMIIIPIRFKTTFLTISADSVGVCKHALGGSPEYEFLNSGAPSATEMHHGISAPHWTAWARPFRRQSYFQRTDIIFLAREDGAVVHVEIDEKDLIPSFTNVGCLGANVNTAFTATYDRFSDVFITGGDSGPGGVWKVNAREELTSVTKLPNWSPVLDVATSNNGSFWEAENPGYLNGNHRQDGKTNHEETKFRKPDSIFSASGRGFNGSITQWRWGIQARIGLSIDIETPPRQSWMFAMNNNESTHSLYFLMSLPEASIVLLLPEDLSEVTSLSPDQTEFDTSSTTLFAQQPTTDGTILQITATSICKINLFQSIKRNLREILEEGEEDEFKIDKAFALGKAIALAKNSTDGSTIYLLRDEENTFIPSHSWHIEGEVTVISLFETASNTFIVIGYTIHNTAWFGIYSMEGEQILAQKMYKKPYVLGISEEYDDAEEEEEEEENGDQTMLDAITSVCIVHEDDDQVGMMMGTRCGHLVTIQVPKDFSGDARWYTEKLGLAAVEVFPSAKRFNGTAAAFATSDGNLLMMTDFKASANSFRNKNYVLPTDSSEVALAAPFTHSMCSMTYNLSGYDGHMSLLIVTDTGLLLSDVWPHVGQVPRTIPLKGTPSRLIYSHTWNCLVVAFVVDKRPALAFIDTEMGQDISIACDQDRQPSRMISGLGDSKDRITGLSEWEYVKDGKSFNYLLVTTREGRLLIVSVEQQMVGGSRRLKYWTRHRKRVPVPIYSVLGDGQNIFYCAGKMLYWDVLDLVDKTLRAVKTMALDCPITTLRIWQGKIFAVTTSHSLMVLDHHTADEDSIIPIHSDKVTRLGMHMIHIGDPEEEKAVGRPITLFSDQKQGVLGFWVPWNKPSKPLEVIFQCKLSSSIRRFTCARTRPSWIEADRGNKFEVVNSSTDGGEVFGVALDGSMHHFTLLKPKLTRLLGLIQQMIFSNDRMFPLAIAGGVSTGRPPLPEDDGEALSDSTGNSNSINGDLLQICLDDENLEELFAEPEDMDRLCEYLDDLDDGKWTTGFEDSDTIKRQNQYLLLTYNVLEYLLAAAI